MMWMNMFWRNCVNDKRKSLHSWRMRSNYISKTLFWKKEPKSHQRLRTMVNGILEQQQLNMFISQKERSRARAAAVCSSEGAWEKAEIVDLACQESSCSKGGKCYFEYDTAKKGQGKGNRSRSSVKRRQFRRTTIRQRDREKPTWKRRSSYVFQLQKRKL